MYQHMFWEKNWETGANGNNVIMTFLKGTFAIFGDFKHKKQATRKIYSFKQKLLRLKQSEMK